MPGSKGSHCRQRFGWCRRRPEAAAIAAQGSVASAPVAPHVQKVNNARSQLDRHSAKGESTKLPTTPWVALYQAAPGEPVAAEFPVLEQHMAAK